jgi:hypothetical protein
VVLLGSLDKGQNSGEGLDSIGISSHHQVTKTDIVVGSNVARDDTREKCLLVELNVVHHLESQGIVSQKTVNTQQSNDGEVTKHLVQGSRTVLSSSFPIEKKKKKCLGLLPS